MKLKLTPVAPIGKRTAMTFHGPFEIDAYPEPFEGKVLAEIRKGLNLTLREAAKRMGLSASELSDLEQGRATCEWEEAKARLLGKRATGTPIQCPLCVTPMEGDERYGDWACPSCGLAGPTETIERVRGLAGGAPVETRA